MATLASPPVSLALASLLHPGGQHLPEASALEVPASSWRGYPIMQGNHQFREPPCVSSLIHRPPGVWLPETGSSVTESNAGSDASSLIGAAQQSPQRMSPPSPPGLDVRSEYLKSPPGSTPTSLKLAASLAPEFFSPLLRNSMAMSSQSTSGSWQHSPLSPSSWPDSPLADRPQWTMSSIGSSPDSAYDGGACGSPAGGSADIVIAAGASPDVPCAVAADVEEEDVAADNVKKLQRLVWLQLQCSQSCDTVPSPVVSEALSCGTLGHPHSCAVPCKFFATRRGCKDGMACSHCHACHWRSCLRRTTRYRSKHEDGKAAA